ncbi:MAG: DNA-directed RNA polymerase subunit omega [Acidobacteriota bacterium]
MDSKFRYVLVAAHRAEQLIRGGRRRLEGNDKPTTAAMAEVSQDVVEWEYGPAPVVEPPVIETEEAPEEEVH